MQAGRIVAVKNASNYDNNSDQNQRVMRPQRGPEQLTNAGSIGFSLSVGFSFALPIYVDQEIIG